MTIVVTVLEFPEGSPLTESSMTFSEQGGTLGRTQNNTWVLHDPERFLSGNHCQITFDQGDYYLLDTSTNGTFVNDSGEPLGKGNRIKLNSGDSFELSDYKFQVQILAASNPAAIPQNANILDIDDPFAAAPASPSLPSPVSSSDPFASSFSGGDLPISNDLPMDMVAEETDPLAALNKSSQAFTDADSSESVFANSYSDHASAGNQAVDWPSSAAQGGLIPENWDDDLISSEPPQDLASEPTPKPNIFPDPVLPPKSMPQAVASPGAPAGEPITTSNQVNSSQPSDSNISISESEARRRALEKENRRIRAEVSKLKKQVLALKKRSSTSVDTALVDAIGFNSQSLGDEKISEINEISGEFIRQVVEGLMQTLASRNNVKNTFRMNMTTIQPVENNPLKFSANVDDALDNMFLKEGNSYKKPIETIQESFASIADHQVAILAGIRSAFKSIVDRFDPTTLETRFDKQNKRGLIPRNEKAKNWEAFHAYYAELFSDIDSSFQYLFGDEFSQAYEEQLQRLSHARKENKSKT